MQFFLTRQFVIFVLTGGTAATINFVSRILYSRWLDFSSAVILAYITGMIVAFGLAKLFVFKQSRQSLAWSGGFFVLVNLAAVAQTWVISMVLAYRVLPWLGVSSHEQAIAHALGIAVPVFTSYIGHKRWSFR